MRYIIALLLTSTAALAEVPKVVTDIPPVHALVAGVMGDLGQPELLLDRGASEHDFQLRPSQAAAVAGADIVVWIGPDLTPWLANALDARGAEGATLGLLAAPGTYLQDYGATGEGHDHAVEAGHEKHGHEEHGHEEAGHEEHGHEEAEHEEAGHAEKDHAHSGTDPHAWLDPANAAHWTNLIAAELSRLDPANAPTYAANAAATLAAITAAETEAAALLAPVSSAPFVTFHDAYGYFTGHFGLSPAGTIALGDAASPGAARLSELRATLESGTVPCIFPEAQHDPALVLQMAEGTGTRVGGLLDPVGSTLEPGPGAYGALLTGMARTLSQCLSG